MKIVNKRIFLVDIDGTFVNAGEQLKNMVEGYTPENQKTYDIPQIILEQFNKLEFYLDGNLNTINGVINYLNNNTENKINTKIVFLSKCLSEEVAQAKIEYVKNNIHKLKSKEYSFENIIYGNPDLNEIIKKESSFYGKDCELEFHCLDDNPERLLDYIKLREEFNYNLNVVPVKHPYNINLINENEKLFSNVISL